MSRTRTLNYIRLDVLLPSNFDLEPRRNAKNIVVESGRLLRFECRIRGITIFSPFPSAALERARFIRVANELSSLLVSWETRKKKKEKERSLNARFERNFFEDIRREEEEIPLARDMKVLFPWRIIGEGEREREKENATHEL